MLNKFNDVPLKKLIDIFFVYALVTLAALVILKIIDVVFVLDFFKYLGDDVFSDFAEVLVFADNKNPYQSQICLTQYPPLAIILFKPFSLMCKSLFNFSPDLTREDFVNVELGKILNEPLFLLSYLAYFLITLSITAFLFVKICKKYNLPRRTPVFLIFSNTFAFVFLRGNILLVALIFCLIYLLYFDDDSKIKREIALIALAISGAIKLYPLVFGVLLIKNKQWKESFRVALYFTFFFIIPFFFFEGGLYNIEKMIGNMGMFVSTERRFVHVTNLSFEALFYKLFYFVFSNFFAADYKVVMFIGKILVNVLLIHGIFVCFVFKDMFRTFAVLCNILILYPSISYYYSICFFVLAIIAYLIEYKQVKTIYKYFMLITFIVIYCIAYLIFGHYVFQSLFILIFTVVLIADGIKEFITFIKNKKEGKNESCNFSRR